MYHLAMAIFAAVGAVVLLTTQCPLAAVAMAVTGVGLAFTCVAYLGRDEAAAPPVFPVLRIEAVAGSDACLIEVHLTGDRVIRRRVPSGKAIRFSIADDGSGKTAAELAEFNED